MGAIRMARPTLRKGSKNLQYDQRIPVDVRDRVRGQKIIIPVGSGVVEKRVSAAAIHMKLSLQTDDHIEGKLRHAEIDAFLEGVYEALRSHTPIKLTHKQCVALAGEFYRAWSGEIEQWPITCVEWNEDGTPTINKVEDGLIGAGFEPDDLAEVYSAVSQQMSAAKDWMDPEGKQLAALLKRWLVGKGFVVEDRSMKMLLAEVRKAIAYAFEAKQKNAQGNYSADPKADHFPSLSEAFPKRETKDATAGRGRSHGLTFDVLLSEWKAHPEQRGIAQSTVDAYFRAIQKLRAFLKHDNAHAVTRSDVQRFAEHRAKEVSQKTVNDSNLAALKAVFGWAVRWDRHPGPNPAEGVRLKQRKQPTVRSDRGFTESEAKAILRHALSYVPKSKSESKKMVAAKRWVPWLMAYSGVRVGEVAQLRKQDVIQHEGHWAIRISYEAGTTKTKATWEIPLHPHLIERGFLEFVKAAPDGHLFLTPRPDLYDPNAKESRTKHELGVFGPLAGVKNRLREFAREVVTRETARPNHGWRHRFKTVGRAADVETVVLDAFHDHAAPNESGKYGQSFEAMVNALAKMPRYEVE